MNSRDKLNSRLTENGNMFAHTSCSYLIIISCSRRVSERNDQSFDEVQDIADVLKLNLKEIMLFATQVGREINETDIQRMRDHEY